MTVLNLIAADVLTQFADDVDGLIAKGTEKRLAIVKVLREYIKDSKAVRFEGDGYSEEWVVEAEKRGLANVKETPVALDAYVSEKSVKLYEKYNVLSLDELEARNEIKHENYIMKVQIEARTMGDLALNHIIPTAIKYQNRLIDNAQGLKDLGLENSSVVSSIERVSKYLITLNQDIDDMVNERKRVNQIEDSREKAIAYCNDIKLKYFDKIRYAVDHLELLIDDEDWPLPKYREMLFIK